MNSFKRLLASLLIFWSTACQTSLASKDLTEWEDEAPWTWDDLERQIQSGQPALSALNPDDAQRIERSALALLPDKRNWGRIEYLVQRLERLQAPLTYELALKLRTHLAMAQRDLQGAETQLLKLFGLQPESSSIKMALGLLYLQGAQFPKAIPYLNDLKPDPRAVLGLIAAHRQLEQNDVVDALCEKYREVQADNWEITLNCSLFESQNMASPEKALSYLQESLALQPEGSEASVRLKEAITRIESSRVISPAEEDSAG